MTDLFSQLKNLNNLFPSQPPSAFDIGVVEQLREIATLIENRTLTITHFSITMESDSSRQKLELEVV